jgi:hypothetical protein
VEGKDASKKVRGAECPIPHRKMEGKTTVKRVVTHVLDKDKLTNVDQHLRKGTSFQSIFIISHTVPGLGPSVVI